MNHMCKHRERDWKFRRPDAQLGKLMQNSCKRWDQTSCVLGQINLKARMENIQGGWEGGGV